MNNKRDIAYINIDEKSKLFYFQNLLPEENEYEKPYFLKIGAIDKKTRTAVGIAVFRENDDSVDLDYLYVSEGFRFQGIGKQLLKLIQQYTLYLSKEKGNLMQLAIPFDTINEELYRFLCERVDMDIDYYGKIYTLTAEDIAESATLRRALINCTKDTSLMSAGIYENELLQKKLKSIDESLRFDKFDRKWVELSQVEINKNEVEGCMLFHIIDEKNIEIEYMFNEGKNPAIMTNMIANAYKKIEHDYPEASVHFTLMDDMFDKKQLFMKKYPIGYIGAAKWNYLPIANEK